MTNFQSYASYPPDAFTINTRTGDLVALSGLDPKQQKYLLDQRTNPVAVRNLFIPLTLEIPLGYGLAPAPLTLYITPNTFQQRMAKGFSENRLRDSIRPEFWGDELDVWTFSGDIAAFYTGEHGITQLHRLKSPGFQNFLSLLSFYKNNGREYWDRGQVIEVENTASRLTLPQRGANRVATNQLKQTGRRVVPSPLVPKREVRTINLDKVIKNIVGVKLTYDGYTAIGHFDNFNWTENVQKPFSISYTMTFTVSWMSDAYRSTLGLKATL